LQKVQIKCTGSAW